MRYSDTANKDPKVQKTTESLKIEMYVIIAGMTPEDMEWKEAAIDKILEMYGGWKDERCLQPDMEEWLKTYFIRLGHKNLNYALCGSYEGHFGLKVGNLIHSATICEEAFALKKEWEKKGTFMAAVGGDASMGGLGTVGGGGGSMMWEFFAHFDANEKDSISGLCNYITEVSEKFQKEKQVGPDFCRVNEVLEKGRLPIPMKSFMPFFAIGPSPRPTFTNGKSVRHLTPTIWGSSDYSTLKPEALKK